MSKLISISVDLTKIPKNVIVEGKNGGKYINLDVTIKDEPDQYGQDVAVTIRQSKEDREAKQPRTFCGNGKTLFGFTKSDSTPTTTTSTGSAADDLF
jgi:hypothetical protein